MKKLVLAVVLGYAWLMVSNYLIHGIWLMHDYVRTPDSWRPMVDMQHKMWIMYLGQLVFTVFFAWVYTRGAEKKPSVGQGIRYGMVISLLTVVPDSLSEFVIYRVPHLLALKWMIAGSVQIIVMGVIVAGVCKDAAPTGAGG